MLVACKNKHILATKYNDNLYLNFNVKQKFNKKRLLFAIM